MTGALFVQIAIPKKLEVLRRPLGTWRFRVVHGGRGGGKTYAIAAVALEMCLQAPTRALVLRLTEKSLTGTVKETWDHMVQRMGVADRCRVLKDRIEFDNGSAVFFMGLGDGVEAIKSFHDVNLAIVEEAQEMGEAGWDILEGTIRGKNSEIWLCGNTNEDAFFCREFADAEPDPDALVIKINFDENAYIDPSFIKTVRRALRRNWAKARAIYWGERYVPEEQQVFTNVHVDDFEVPEGVEWMFGLDFGIRNPTALVGCFVVDVEDEDGEPAQDLHIGAEFYAAETPPRKLAAIFDRDHPYLRDSLIVGDIASSVSIEQLTADGFNVRGCHKTPGFKEKGIEALQNFRRVVIAPGCTDTAREFTQLRYRKLKSGEISDQIDPRCDDHAVDACRYALQDVIGTKLKRARGSGFFAISVAGETQHTIFMGSAADHAARGEGWE